jgi:hypothetical protein
VDWMSSRGMHGGMMLLGFVLLATGGRRSSCNSARGGDAPGRQDLATMLVELAEFVVHLQLSLSSTVKLSAGHILRIRDKARAEKTRRYKLYYKVRCSRAMLCWH